MRRRLGRSFRRVGSVVGVKDMLEYELMVFRLFEEMRIGFGSCLFCCTYVYFNQMLR